MPTVPPLSLYASASLVTVLVVQSKVLATSLAYNILMPFIFFFFTFPGKKSVMTTTSRDFVIR
jgi:hypothetical protein